MPSSKPRRYFVAAVEVDIAFSHTRQGDVIIEYDGNGFLYKMVRLIIGALVTSALGKVSIENVAARLNSGQVSTPRFVAPPEGLSLVRVRY